jgi:hypothetical protein
MQLRRSIEAERDKECTFVPKLADDRGQRERAKRSRDAILAAKRETAQKTKKVVMDDPECPIHSASKCPKEIAEIVKIVGPLRSAPRAETGRLRGATVD